ncbi:hypothetical protein BDZ94DRAFT_10318 [Collybia nuda]|uniref:Uncharacterized protein n=1 Tax=Collybia nuda TaxID=64659 RepID=A0A9P5YJ52_9AGAR|nr:hypothetical protein BDZ94DRAFT_10318 [Collybia nuda]
MFCRLELGKLIFVFEPKPIVCSNLEVPQCSQRLLYSKRGASNYPRKVVPPCPMDRPLWRPLSMCNLSPKLVKVVVAHMSIMIVSAQSGYMCGPFFPDSLQINHMIGNSLMSMLAHFSFLQNQEIQVFPGPFSAPPFFFVVPFASRPLRLHGVHD